MVKGKILKSTTPYAYIPHDILFFGILNRLPVKSLLRFKCVSKLWCAMIVEPEFTTSHLTCTTEKSSSSIAGFFQVKYKDSKKQSCDYIFVNKEENPEYFSVQPKQWPGTSRAGDCNGLFCFRSRSGFEICNPSTHEVLYHPLPPRPPPHCVVSYGFGFDPLKNEYKVVQIVDGKGSFRRCMVCTLGSNNSSWKGITVASNLSKCLNHSSLRGSRRLGLIVNSDGALYSNGALHWYFRWPHIVMSFDIHYEKLSLIRGPNRENDFRRYRCFLTEWQGCLCVAFHSANGAFALLYRYKLKHHDYIIPGGVQGDIWDEGHVVLPYKPNSSIGVLGGEHHLLYWFTGGHLSLYSPEKRDSRDTYRYGSERKVKYLLPLGINDSVICEYKFFRHVENLLSLKKLVTSSPSQARRMKDKDLVQVKSVSSL
ncbi:hypothetical protein IFM89_023491 [Coptis chinensis]|uniref:F-box domain-containing protein n=1 Tax=Coptis chinensis TaxID=261450 RepID=A0A835I7D2_9MAGN|nr:hypothetical protein IFM89_023491 [Coptis chinensis]